MKIGLILFLIVAVIVSIRIWRFLGKPYYRISLIGTEYIENAHELSYANAQLENKLYLIKKYKYSEDKIIFGFGGGQPVTDDYYSYGVADNNKNILIEPKYLFISSRINLKKEPIIFGRPYADKGTKKMVFFKIINEKLIEIDETAGW